MVHHSRLRNPPERPRADPVRSERRVNQSPNAARLTNPLCPPVAFGSARSTCAAGVSVGRGPPTAKPPTSPLRWCLVAQGPDDIGRDEYRQTCRSVAAIDCVPGRQAGCIRTGRIGLSANDTEDRSPSRPGVTGLAPLPEFQLNPRRLGQRVVGVFLTRHLSNRTRWRGSDLKDVTSLHNKKSIWFRVAPFADKGFARWE